MTISFTGSGFFTWEVSINLLGVRDDLAVSDRISYVLERISAVSCKVSVSSWVEAWARFLSEIAFFRVAAVLSNVLENFSAVSLRVFWKVLAVSEIVFEKNMRDSILASDLESSKGMEMSRKESLLLT